MGKKSESERRFCGNCHHHSMYRHPDLLFCRLRYLNRQDPVVPTLGSCEQWKHYTQECFCVEEALRKRGQKEEV